MPMPGPSTTIMPMPGPSTIMPTPAASIMPMPGPSTMPMPGPSGTSVPRKWKRKIVLPEILPSDTSDKDSDGLPDLPIPQLPIPAPVANVRRKSRGRKKTTVPTTESTSSRVARLREERINGLRTLVGQLDFDQRGELLVAIADSQPGLVFNIAEKITKPNSPMPTTVIPVPSWCVCHRCREMPTDAERLCCGLQPQNCLSQRAELELVVLDPAVLTIAITARNEYLVRGRDDDANKEFRQEFVYWRHNRLGAGNRRVIPSCVIWKIRERFPDQFGHYVGFLPGRLA